MGGAVASLFVRQSPERAVWVRALSEVLALCCWATQVYKWVPANLMLGGNPAMD